MLLPDGTPAGAGVRVTTTFGGAEVTVTTAEDGTFHFSPIIPAGNRPLVALDPVSTLTWKGYVVVPAGGDVAVNPRLLGRGTLTVRALNADGTPAPGAAVDVKGTAYPNDTAAGVNRSRRHRRLRQPHRGQLCRHRRRQLRPRRPGRRRSARRRRGRYRRVILRLRARSPAPSSRPTAKRRLREARSS